MSDKDIMKPIVTLALGCVWSAGLMSLSGLCAWLSSRGGGVVWCAWCGCLSAILFLISLLILACGVGVSADESRALRKAQEEKCDE